MGSRSDSSNYIRVGFDAKALKSAIKGKIDGKIVFTKDPKLRNDVARVYGQIVTPYVPRSDDNGEYTKTYIRKDGEPITKTYHKKVHANAHHLQDFVVSDGRVTWHRTDSSGNEIAKKLFEGPPRGKWHVRALGDGSMLSETNRLIEYSKKHTPKSEWTSYVAPGTRNYAKFVKLVTPLIKERIEHG